MSTSDKIALFSAIGGWVSGIGTFLAVLVSLYLANRKPKLRLKCQISEMTIVSRSPINHGSQKPGIAMIITNLSSVPVRIQSLGWSCGKDKYWHQILGDVDSAVLPKTIEYGNQAVFWIDLEGREEEWFFDIGKLLKEAGADTRKMRLCVSTSTGRLFYFKPDKEFVEKIASKMNEI